MRRRAGTALALVLAVLATACSSTGSAQPTGASAGRSAEAAPGTPGGGTATATPTEAIGTPSQLTVAASTRALMRTACRNTPHEALVRTWRGTRPDRSGDIQLIPADPAFVSGGLTHASPFDDMQEVPLLLYGPGFVRPGAYTKPVTLADIAPTLGEVLKFPFDTVDGDPQRQVLQPAPERDLPRLVVTVVWDAAGMDVLDRWPNDWPFLASMRSRGAWFTNAEVGASPSNTPPGHATIGTGTFPMHNGILDEFVRVNGVLQKPNANGPAFLVDPTLADLYDRAMGNEPKVGTVATLSGHVMMMSHGSQWGGGDRDLAVTREKEGAKTGGAESDVWGLTTAMAPYYRLPAYANDLPPLSDYVDDVDRADGALDGRWRTNDIEQLRGGFDTPARTPFQQTLVEAVVQREGFGADDVPDLLFINYKAIDSIGHLFSADGIEMSDAVRTQDDALASLVRFLNRTVGKGEWVMALTSDHGTREDPDVTGAFLIDIAKLETGLTATFDDDDGVPLLQKVRPTQIWLDRSELADNGFTLAQVATWLDDLTQQDTYAQATPPAPGHERDRVFDAAVPSSILAALPCLPEARVG